MKERSTMVMFLKRVTPPQEEPPVDHSGHISKKGVVIRGDDSFMYVIAPEDLPVRQKAKVKDRDINDCNFV